MSSKVLTKELLVSTALLGKFNSLKPAAAYVKRVRAQKPCGECGKQTETSELSDDLFSAIVRSHLFSQEAADLAGFLQADPLLVPGLAEPVRPRSRAGG